jgi:hypothetical protein
MPPAPAQLTFVSSLFASKIFWTQAVALLALILSTAGYHVIDAPGAQEQLIGFLDVTATMLLRWLSPTGPVSLSAPFSTPAPQDVPAGASVVTVPAKADLVQASDVQPLDIGRHTVEVVPASPRAPAETPATTVVTAPAPFIPERSAP